MPVHPIEYRYGSEEMRRIFDYRRRIKLLARIEAELARVEAELGVIPREAADSIAKAAEQVDWEDVLRWEKVTRHETMALVKAIAEKAGRYGEYVHFGATSNDILDTATAVQISEASEILKKKLISLTRAIIRRGRESLEYIAPARTHGMIAIPIPFGFKFAVWASMMRRNIERFIRASEDASKGKLSGAVGTMAALGEIGPEVQRRLMRSLKIGESEISTQVVPRDGLAYLIEVMALISSCLDLIANEIRNLHRSEIGEVVEPFNVREQTGSSTMPQKVNPINSEKVCGLARIMRGLVVPSLENVVLEHERDLTNSSVERIIVPEAFLILDEQLETLLFVMENLVMRPDAMRSNIERTRGLIMAERLMMALAKKGFGRQSAHEIVRQLSLRAMREKRHLKEEVLSDEIISNSLSREELDEIFDPATYVITGKKIALSVFDSVEKFLDSLEGKTT